MTNHNWCCCLAAVLLLMVVVSVHGQITGPKRPTTGVDLFLQEANSSIANFTVLAAGSFGDIQDNILWCQSANSGNPIGDWYFPNGDQVTTNDNDGPLHVLHLEGQIGLLRDANVAGLEGLYICVIPDENNITQTLWVGIYRTSAHNDASKMFTINNPMEFSVVSSSDTDPPVFTLSFNVTNVPPTTVECEVNGTIIDTEYVDRQVIIATDPVTVLVTVTINSRQSGSYRCGISAASAGGTRVYTDPLDITVTDIVTNLTHTQPGFQQAIIQWSPPVSNNPIVQGYMVYYYSPNGTTISIDVGSSTMITLTSLNPEVDYTVLVVAYGGDLPSAPNRINITRAYSIDAPSQSVLQYGDIDVTITCVLDVNVELSSLQLAWFLSDIINSTEFDFSFENNNNDTMFTSGDNQTESGNTPMEQYDNSNMVLTLSLDLNIREVNESVAGLYTCGALLNDSLGRMANVSTDHTISIQLPDPVVTINTAPGTMYGRTFISGSGNVYCNAEIPLINAPVYITFTWWGPQGQITDGDSKYEIENELDFGNNSNVSHLVIQNLEANDNLTMYYCQVDLNINNTNDSYNAEYIIPGRTQSDNATISFEELPVASVIIVPDGAPLIGKVFTMTCNATFNETIASVTYQWLINGSDAFRSGVSFSSDNSSLSVSNVSISDEGTYTCIATLDIAGIEVATDTVANATYDFSTLDDPIVVITTDGSNIAGSVYTLTCTVTVVTGIPNITWIDPNGNEVDDSLVTLNIINNFINELILQFSPLDYNDIGQYGCFANLSVPDVNFLGMGSDSTIVDIEIPTPNVTIATDNTDTIIRGTEISITCVITLNPPLPMNTNVTLEWRKDGSPFDNSTDRVTESSLVQGNDDTYSSTITFSPVNATDSGDYQCRGVVNPEMENNNMIGSNNTGSLSITVDDTPDATVSLFPTGTGMINNNYSLTCSVSIADNLIDFYDNLTLEMMNDNGYMILEYSTIATTITVDLSPLTTANAGMYKCSYNIRQDVINYQRIFENTTNITVTIPPPIVQVTTNPNNASTLIGGTYIDLVCNSTISDGVDTDITVTNVWSKDGTTIVNGPEYSISNVTLVSGYYVGTVRIEELKVTDNNAVFNCTVTVTPSISTHITENTNSDETILAIRAFEQSDVTVAISFSSVPTAGDQLNVSCSAVVPERLIHSPISYIISYDGGSQMVVADDNPDATQSDVTSNGNTFSRVVTINPVKTSDARKYYCIVSFNFQDSLVISTTNEDLSVYIAPPSMSISLTPDGIIYESTLLVITCNATLSSVVDTDVTSTVTWTGPNGIVNSNGRIMVNDEAASIGDNVFQSLLTFQPVDNGDEKDGLNDTGQYNCSMTISSSDSLILSANNNITEDFTVTDLPELDVTISTSGSTEVGQSLNITCSVVLVEGLVGNIDIMWDKIDGDMMGDTGLPMVTVVDGPTTNITLILDPVVFSNRGMYMCEVIYNITVTDDAESQSASANLTVDFPPFDIAISQDYSDPLYTGTNLTITCNITFDSLVDIPIIVNNQWTRNGTMIEEKTITEYLICNSDNSYTATLEFYPLYSMTDDGEYRCSVDVIPNLTDNSYITNISDYTSTSIDVFDLPDPIVTVNQSSSNPIAGESFVFTCTVSVIDRLIVSPEITWSKYVSSDSIPLPDDINVDPILSNPFESSLEFISLNTSDVGRYTCDAVVTLPQISVERSNNDFEDLTLQIPTPVVTVERSQTDLYVFAGSELTIYCNIDIDTNVDTPFTLSTTWTMADFDNNVITLDATTGRVVVYDPYTTGTNQYQSRIEFSTLSNLVDTGNYTCDVLIDSNSNYTFIYDSYNDNDTTAVHVISPSIVNFSAFPDQFLGLETSCTDSDPFDHFVLNCTGSKPLIVLPELELFWLHNGTLRSSNSVTYNMTIGNEVHKLTSLSFPTSTVEDSGSYECVARLVIPDSDNITRTEESLVTIRPVSRPYPAVNISTSVSTTSANITFFIPAIAYTPEQYYVELIGLELQNQLTNSTMRMGVNDITATNLEYTITLTGLEEDNSYNFSVVSVNCEGPTSTSINTITTLPSAPSGKVIDCTNTTFNPTNVTLTWNAPLRELQNGDVTGYELYCKQKGSSLPVPDTNNTLLSSNTTYTIPVITPFRLYNCSISAVNDEGVGPETFCQFNSAQDVPSDSPSNFNSTAGQFSVNFTWGPPVIPNGIVIRYLLRVSIMQISVTGEMMYDTNEYMTNADQEHYTIGNLSAYQNYNATLTASTVIGYGPEAKTSGTTRPDLPPAVQLYTIPATGFENILTLPAVDGTTLNVTWETPNMPNGNITHFNIAVTNMKSEPNQFLSVFAVDRQLIYTYLVTGLNAGTPYYVTIGAVNQEGQGDNVTVIGFTGNLKQTVTLTLNDPDRSEDGTAITVSWNPVSLEVSGGFFETTVTLTRSSRKRQSPLTKTVPFDESSVTFDGLDKSVVYSVTAGIVVIGQNGTRVEGPITDPIEIVQNSGDEPLSTDITPIIIGVVVGVIVLIIIIVVVIIVVVVIRRRGTTGKAEFSSRRKGQRNDLFELSTTNGGTVLRPLNEPSDLDDTPANGNGISFAPLENEKDPVDEEEDPKKKLMEEDMAYLEAEKTIDRSKPVAKASFHEHVQQLHKDADKEYESEYKSVSMSTDSSIDCGKNETNKPKNRFKDILPYDFSRVKLPLMEGISDSDYINASYVDGYNRKDCYVCAQGPLPTTVGDFWRMIYEKRITSLVMLTGVVEGGKKKCEQYWPENVGETMDLQGGLQVAMTSKVPFSDYTIHSLKVTQIAHVHVLNNKKQPGNKEASVLDVNHFHFTAWPDHGVPQFATSLIGFINRVQKSHDKTKGIPLLVHCSAGVGRTGTFVMLDSMMDRLRVEDSLNVYEFLRQMRSKRMFMVQTLTQYVFIHDALDEYITCGETDIPASNLKVRVSKMHKIVPSKNITGFQEQYQLLEQVCYVPNETTYSDAKKPFNTPKNRYPDIVPLNLNRPRLRPDGSEGSDYINSSCVDGYKQRNAYLVTQGPMKNTTEDFWRLIVEFKSRNIVMLCNTIEEGQEKCFMYWPTKEGEPVEYGKHKVTLQSETVNGDYIIRKLLIQNEKSSLKTEREGVVITQFHYTQWSEHGHPKVTGQIIEMVDMLTRCQMNTGNKPITVVCNDGVGRSGAFLCIHSQLERLKTEGEIDVFKYLKSARTKRIGLVSEMDHYVFVHEVLADYVESFDPYANFKN